jgi:hypothetical protein
MEKESERDNVDENIVINEFGEEIAKNQLEEIAKKVKKLNPKEIDELFCDCGWKEYPSGDNKALPLDKIEEIKNDDDMAISMITCLFEETPKEEFLYVIRYRTGLYSKVIEETEKDENESSEIDKII